MNKTCKKLLINRGRILGVFYFFIPIFSDLFLGRFWTRRPRSRFIIKRMTKIVFPSFLLKNGLKRPTIFFARFGLEKGPIPYRQIKFFSHEKSQGRPIEKCCFEKLFSERWLDKIKLYQVFLALVIGIKISW